MKKDEENISNIIESIFSGIESNMFNYNSKFNKFLEEIMNNSSEIN